jgi:hypothetical protein
VTSIATLSRRPTVSRLTTTVTEISAINTYRRRATGTPTCAAWTGSNVSARRSPNDTATVSSASAVSDPAMTRSVRSIVTIWPNKKCVMSTPIRSVWLMSSTPSANIRVSATPMIESCPSRRRPSNTVMTHPITRPAASAPSVIEMPAMYAAATPARVPWLIASPR